MFVLKTLSYCKLKRKDLTTRNDCSCRINHKPTFSLVAGEQISLSEYYPFLIFCTLFLNGDKS